MEVEGTQQAFAALINQRGIYKALGVDRRTVAGWKIYLKEGKSISLDKMEEMLIKGGATVKQEKVWRLDSISYEGLNNAMADFYEELGQKKVGDTIQADFRDNLDRTLVENSIHDHAKLLRCSVLVDLSDREVLEYTFFNRS